MPISIADLPPELLPELLAPLVSRRDLYAVCLVCRDWRDVGQRRLFNHIRLFGRDLAIAPQLFRTLAHNARLAALVRKLEVRVYPISLKVTEQAETERLAIAMLHKCINCEELVWTRKGALTDLVWSAIHAMPRLRSLELNAHTNLSPGSWSAENLVSLRPLRSLSLILPDRNVASILPDFFARQNASSNEGGQLEEFSVLCRESPVVNNAVVRAIAPFLARSRLASLALAGCSKLGGDPLLELLPTLPLLRHLALEACNLEPRFYTQIAPSLCNLESIKLTHPGPRHPSVATFFPAIEGLLAALPRLAAFTLYHSGASADGRREWPVLPESFARNVATSNGAVLRKFEVSGILCTVTAAEVLAEGARNLRNLVLHLESDFDLDRLTSSFSPLEHLRTLHLLSQRATVSLDAVLELAQHCSPTLRQIGFRNRVWIVKRNYTAEGEGPKTRFYETAAAFGAFRRNRYGAESDVKSEAEEASSSSSDSDSESDA